MDCNATVFKKFNVFLLCIAQCVIYGYLAYFTTRTQFVELIVLVIFVFLSSLYIVKTGSLSFKQLIGLSIIFRLIFLLSIPQLSQDFFRFYWDGQLILSGLNPYLHTVDYFFDLNEVDFVAQAEILKQGMGSLNAGNYSNYPPFSQFLYAVSSWIANNSILAFIIALRLFLTIFDLLLIVYARKILNYLSFNKDLIFLYVLNPLCILETTGNLHLEGVMISLFVISIYFLIKNKIVLSALFLGLSIGTKLLSLIALPLIIVYLFKHYKLKWLKPIFLFLVSVAFILILQFIPFFNYSFINNFYESIGLWFVKFEFNASIYYLIRWLGFQIYGYNIIQTYGVVMPILTIVLFLIFILKTKSLKSVLENFLWMLTIYFLLSTTVHPWYILFPLSLSVILNYRFGLLWSILGFLSYHAYASDVFKEDYTIIALEYILLLGFIFFEIFREKCPFKISKRI